MAGKKPKLTLDEQRISIQDKMIKALAFSNMEEYDRLNGHLIWIEQKIEKEKQK